ncbi:S8 family serine peptidase [Massilia sp.]|uniref:S8 family serine peptidase n=1 Tax=Massilia sp. TaxID=1882437 RepID=UPI00391AFA22
MKLRPVSLAVLALAASLSFSAAQAQEVRRPYIVQLADKPAASYEGGIAGLPATKPVSGKLNVNAADVQNYISYLEQKQASVQATVANAEILHTYSVAFNGFAAMLTDSEVRDLKKNSAVAHISVDEERHLETNYTPVFLGLTQPGTGLWDKLGGKGAAGEDVIIGVVDGGIWPENLAYADRVDGDGRPTFDVSGTLAYSSVPGDWKGICQTGEGFTLNNCNNKLIGARYFDTTYKSQRKTTHYSDFVSPRDSMNGPDLANKGGHGTHTSSTAGGNAMVPTRASNGSSMGDFSGIAPKARIASYKVCWTYLDPTNPDLSGTRNGCYGSDSVAAINQAVADGVDVINFSISGSQTDVMDPVEVAFFNAASAGVFVATSAGNSGPGNAVAHLSPWVTTVAASTHNRISVNSVTLAGGATYQGQSYNATALPNTPMILAEDAGITPYAQLSAADKQARRLCYTAADRANPSFNTLGATTAAAALDPSVVAGKIVICARGNTARVDKGAAVKEAGGAGMILTDTGTALVADPHVLPAIHVSLADGNAIRSWLSTRPEAAASIATSRTMAGPTPAPRMASFSSRGPNKGDPNVLKPDLTAPGVDILAAVSAPGNQALRDDIANNVTPGGLMWQSLQGTSMSSPHVAGMGALLRQLRPSWSPAAIKSALMTTAYSTQNDGVAGMSNGLLPWAQGAGHTAPNLAADPGLVYDSNAIDWIRYLCGIGKLAANSANCVNFGSIQPYNLNLPSLTASDVLGRLTLSRTVTNVGDATATYTASTTLDGYEVAVSPSTLTLAPGAKASFTVTLTNKTAPIGAWSYGSLTWSDGKRVVRSPLTARASALAVRGAISSEAVNGAQSITIGTGYTGPLTVQKGGLKPALRSTQTVGQANKADGGLAECAAGNSAGVKVTTVTVPANTLVARFTTRDVDTSGYQGGGVDDLDLIVLNSAGTVVGNSGQVSSNETVTLNSPAAGTYRVCVVGYAPRNGSSTYVLNSWVVSTSDTGGNFKASGPAIVYTGGTGTVSTSWSDLEAGKNYLGAIRYLQGTTVRGMTLVEVDATDPLPAAQTSKPVTVAAN